MQENKSVKSLNVFKKIIDNFSFLFFWLPWFYPRAVGVPIIHLLYFFIPQKIFFNHWAIPWPVNKTSRVLFWQNITMGNRCTPGMNAHCYIQARNGIVLGNNVRIGPGVGLISADHDLSDYDKHKKSKSIIIGNNVWIGMNSVVLPGVQIGDNVVIGAGSIVTYDIPSNSIAGGNPCKVIRQKEPYMGDEYC